MPDPVKRRAAREQAFALLFELSFHPGEALKDILAAHAALDDDTPAPEPFALEVALCAESHLAELDDAIAQRLKGWKLNRISRAAHAILRLAVCEMQYFDDIPVGASINEAVELAKLYADEEAPRFVNGVLGAIARGGKDDNNDAGN